MDDSEESGTRSPYHWEPEFFFNTQNTADNMAVSKLQKQNK